jgi:DNA repair exonuclease SbcCD nuclease subunit
MSNWPFRFIHAGDFHLEQPLMGVAEVPDHLRDLFLDAPYAAGKRVFDAALAEDAAFVLLCGDILDCVGAGPRGTLFLIEQFNRLAERGIAVYWSGGEVDPPESWPAAIPLPENVHVFPRGRVEELVHQHQTAPLARLAGVSREMQRSLRPLDFAADPAGLFTIAIVHGVADPTALQARGVQYWALGGRHDRSTPLAGPQTVHYCGSPQGRRPEESGLHGCTLVQIDEQKQARTTLIPTDAARWLAERVPIDETTTRNDLETRLRERMHTLAESAPNLPLLICWTIAGKGPLAVQLRRGKLAAELLGWLRSEYGYGQPAAWSVSFDVALADALPPEWYEQETIRGDFLRAIRQLQMNAEESLDLEPYLAESHRAGTLAAAVSLDGQAARDCALCEAALLGVDLLSGEEPQS